MVWITDVALYLPFGYVTVDGSGRQHGHFDLFNCFESKDLLGWFQQKCDLETNFRTLPLIIIQPICYFIYAESWLRAICECGGGSRIPLHSIKGRLVILSHVCHRHRQRELSGRRAMNLTAVWVSENSLARTDSVSFWVWGARKIELSDSFFLFWSFSYTCNSKFSHSQNETNQFLLGFIELY